MKSIGFALVAGLLIAFGLLFIGQPHAEKTAYISITFDDGYSSQYNAAKLLENYSYKGTVYIPSAFIGNEFENISVMSLQQLKDLQAGGHEIGGHTANHLLASRVSEEVYEADVVKGKEILKGSNFSAENFAFPGGDDSKKDIALKYFKTARSTQACINNFSDREICGLTLVNKNTAILQLYLSELKTKGGWLVIVIHDVSANPRADIDITNEELIDILEQINKSGIEVKTVAGVLDETS